MTDIFQELKYKIDQYENRYKYRPRCALRHLWIYVTKLFFKRIKVRKPANYPILNTWCTIENKYKEDVSFLFKQDLDNFIVPKIPVGGSIRFDIDKALLLNPKINRIALVVFNGIGDYFFCTSFIADLCNKYKHLTFDAFVSSNVTDNSNPLVGDLLRHNPNIKNVYTFNGKADKLFWKNFDFSDVYKKVDERTLVLPLIYDYDSSVRSRYLNLCHSYNVTPKMIHQPPLVYADYAANKAVQKALMYIKDISKKKNLNGIVWLQLRSTCFNYRYPHAEGLIEELINLGYFVVCVDKNDIKNDCLFTIDYADFSINDSIKLLAELKKQYGGNLYCMGVISCFTAISAGLNITNLVLQPVLDQQIESVWEKNIFIMTHTEYANIPIQNQFIIDKKSYDYRDYRYTFSLKCVINAFQQLRYISNR